MNHPDEGHARHLDDKARADEAAYQEGSEAAAKADKLKQADKEIERLCASHGQRKECNSPRGTYIENVLTFSHRPQRII